MTASKDKWYLCAGDHSWYNDPVAAASPEDAVRVSEDGDGNTGHEEDGNSWDVYELADPKPVTVRSKVGLQRD